VHGSDVDAGHRDLADLEEIEQGLQGAEGAGLDRDTASGLVDEAQQRGKVGHDFLSHIIFVIVGTADEKSGTSNSFVQIRSRDLDTESGLDLLVVDVLRL
jgi:hypothetical protein